MTDDLTGRCPHGLFIDVFCAVCDEGWAEAHRRQPDTWPRVQWFASRVGANGDFGPGEDRVAVDRSAVLAALDRLAAS